MTDEAGTTTMTWAEDDVVMLSKRDARGVTAMYDYDAEGNVRSETVDGKSSKYTYEIQSSAPFSKSRMTSKEDRNGNRFGFVLDGGGNVVRETLPIGSLTHTYSGVGDRISSTDANGNTTRFEYDSVGNLSATRNALGAAWKAIATPEAEWYPAPTAKAIAALTPTTARTTWSRRSTLRVAPAP
ncbi:RHS repeat protein [Paucibacter sp. O1-1]|nr:RHS repeat protein [Paucibacter sp. O1-1]MDA3824934.1 RHS repeat protein [Paucibacter sp. O1-1]